jgi:GT2 family glycosyltransferase
LTKNIFIHVGPPKTGTSAVQKWFSENEKLLKEKGIYYPNHDIDDNGVSSGNVRTIYDVNSEKQVELNSERLSSLLMDFNNSHYHTLFLSSEFFFRGMIDLKRHIPDAKFIAYLRNPMEISESSYNQSVKRHFQQRVLNAGRSKRLPYIDRFVNYVNEYGADDLILRLYGSRYFKNGNIVSDILNQLGVELEVDLPLVNSSYQFEALEFKRWFNQFHLGNYQVMVDRALQGFIEGNGDYSLIPKEQYIADSTYYASVLEDYAKVLNTSHIDPLVADMKSALPKPYFVQDLSDNQFLSVCQYLQKSLQFDYYLMTKEVMSFSNVENAHFQHLFIRSCNRKYRYIHLLLIGRSKLRNVTKNVIKAFVRNLRFYLLSIKTSNYEVFKSKSMKHVMRAVKFLIGLFPKEARIRMRQQLWLHNLYSKSLQKSGLFYGFPPPHKLQKLYVKNIAEQHRHMASQLKLVTNQRKINCLIVLTGQRDADVQTIRNVSLLVGEGKLFVTGKDVLVRQCCEKASLSNEHHVYDIKQQSEELYSSALLVLRGGDLLHPQALAMFSSKMPILTAESVTYCDVDSLDKSGKRHLAEFYPDWNPDLQLSTGYVKTGIVIEGEQIIRRLLCFAQQHNQTSMMALWMSELYLSKSSVEVNHIEYCLVHQTLAPVMQWTRELVKLSHHPINISIGGSTQNAKISWKHSSTPLVSLIIPTKNAKLLVQTCIDSIVSKTTYAHYEILLIDNNSDDPEALEYFESLQKSQSNIRVLRYPYLFNYSAINNFAVKHAKGEIIGLINNDVEVISPNWLGDMVGHTQREDIGCVGAKLLYPDTRIQHAGVVMGFGGGAGHAHKYFPRYHSGYLHRLVATNNFSAVTAACLLVKKSDYELVNGLNENDLTVAFNDIDFCLKILTLGRRNLYCAEAELFHHESVSRGTDDTLEKRQRFENELCYLQNTWADIIDSDSAYNSNLTLRFENFSIRE